MVSAAVGYKLWRQDRQIDRMTPLVVGSSPTGPSTEYTPVPDRTDLMGRIGELESQVTSLRSRVEGRPYGNKTDADVGGRRDITRAHVDAGNEAEHSFQNVENVVMEALESYNPEIRNRLKAVIQEEQDRIREETRQERRRRRDERAKEQLAKLAQDADLSPTQVTFLTDRLSLERDLISEIFREARADHSYGEASDKAQKIRAETDGEVQELLDDQQFTVYQAMREEEMNRRYGPGVLLRKAQ